MAATPNKHQQLVASICDAVSARLAPQHDALVTLVGTEFADVKTIIAALLARLEVLEVGQGGGAKRAPRGSRKTGGRATAAAASSDDPLDKVKNAMLFTRRMWTTEEFREKYRTPAFVETVDADDKCTKHAEGTEARWLAEGSLFWRKGATDPQKNEIRDEFSRWKEERERAALAEPLAADMDADPTED